MAIYPVAIVDAVDRIQNAGDIEKGAASGRAVNFDCGGFVEISLAVSAGSGTIEDAKFRSNGCGFMVAAADAACRRLAAASLSELHGLEEIGAEMIQQFGHAPELRSGCSDAVIDAVKAAFREHRSRVIDEFTGEQALVCTCFGVSENVIVEFITREQPTSVQEVSDACRAGSGCGSCRMVIQELIDTAERERAMTET